MPRHRPSEVPRLDLAPKLNRPLSLWNPLDYLRLLHWVFYFPQALRWYVETFGGSDILEEEANWQKWLDFLRNNPVERYLVLQGFLITAVVPLLFAIGLDHLQIQIEWFGVALGLLLGVTFGVAGSWADGVAYGVAYGVAFGVAFGVAGSVIGGVTGGVTGGITGGWIGYLALGGAFGAASGIAFGVAGSVIGGTYGGVAFGAVIGIALCMQLCVAGSMVLSLALGMASDGTVYLAGGVALAMAGGIVSLRPDSWLFGAIIEYLSSQSSKRFRLGSITSLALPSMQKNLTNWLRYDWDIGLHNANELLAYTYQFIPVIKTLNRELACLPSEQLVYRASQLAANSFDWNMVRYTSVSLENSLRTQFLRSLFILPFRQYWLSHINTDLRIDLPARAVTAGFWLIHENRAEEARQAFARIRNLLYGEEIYTLAASLALFQEARVVPAIAAIEVPDFPHNPFLRPVTWSTMQRFCNVISDTKTVVGSVSRTSKAFASNRALGELKHILDYIDDVPEAERQLIENIAKQWRNALLDVATSVGEQTIDAPIQNPYVVGDPVEGDLFVGREDVLRQLEELWLMGRQMQSVVLYGHHRMGKTSILRNAAKTVGAGLRLVYVNMLRSASAESISDVLLALTDELSEVMNLPPPSDEALLANPTRTFDRYLKRVLDSLSDGETLIIAIDEFEKIEELIDAGKLSPDFIAYLRGLVQMSPKLGFAFAGLHTLEEMTQDYFNPFFASVIPIKVGFLPPGAVRQLLANPDSGFLLDYDRDALDRIYQLTSGQPYLTQLVGFQLVRRYNEQVFEQGSERPGVFTLDDVNTVAADPEFYTRGRYYFTGVWDQAGRDVPGQRSVLQALAPYPEGRSLDKLAKATQLSSAQLAAALNLLDRHDVVTVEANHARIRVELFRQWLLRQSP